MTRGQRQAKSSVMMGLMYFAAIVATLPLLFILVHLLSQGARFIGLDFFTQMPRPVGDSIWIGSSPSRIGNTSAP